MIEILSGFPDDVLAVEASGEISAEDYRKVLIPAALEKMKGHEAVRLFCQILPGATVEAGRGGGRFLVQTEAGGG